MGAQHLATTAIVLNRTESGDNWLRLVCFSARDGNLGCLVRKSHRAAGKVPPLDLFDDAQLTLESSNQGRTWFVKEAIIDRRRSGLGTSYQALTHSCRFARVLIRNPVHEESRRAVFTLLERALDAWETGTRPDCVYFKSLFLLARDEGYPVQQQWWPELKAEDSAAAESILRQPLAEQQVPETTVARLNQALETYLRHHTEIQVDS